MKRFVILGFACILVSTLVLASGCTNTASATTNSTNQSNIITTTPTSKLVPGSQNLVNGAITINANGYYDQLFTITNGMENTVLSGSFTASGGSGNDVIVYIFNSTNFTNWTNGQQSANFYNSGQVTTQNINVSLESGLYYLVFDNTFSTSTTKVVNATINLNYNLRPGM